MKTSVFQYPYSRVFRKTKDVLSHMGMKIVSWDSVTGSIKARSGFSLNKPAFKVDLIIEEMENHNTKVTVSGITVKNMFFQKKLDAATGETEILDNLSSSM